MNICIVGTSYTLFLYLLVEKKWENTYFIFPSFFDDSVVNSFKVNNIKVYKSYDSVVNKNDLFSKVVNKSVFLLKKWQYKKLVSKLKKHKYIVYGSDYLYEARYFIDSKFVVIEENAVYDGYEKLKEHYASTGELNGVYGPFNSINYIPLGYDDIIKKIYLTGRSTIPQKIENKVEIINPNKLWNNKMYIEKKKILAIWGVSFENIKQLFPDKYTIYLLTQPFSDLGFITEKKLIEIYKDILKKYNKNEIIIKVRTTEKIQYKKYFTDYNVVVNDIPFEILFLLDIPIKTIVTINSTACLGYERWTNRKINVEMHTDIGEKISEGKI